MDFNWYIQQMITEEQKEQQPQVPVVESKRKFHHFKKANHLKICNLNSEISHIKKDKLSEKLSRRDVQYYDLYALQDPPEDYDRMRNDGFPHTKIDA